MPLLTEGHARGFVAEHHRGVLVTLKADGRPQLSNVGYALIGSRVRVSVTDDRAKTANLRRDPRVSLHVTSADFWTYVVAEGMAELSAVAAEPGDETCTALLELYVAVTGGPHPDPEDFHRAMVADRRLQVSFELDHLYPLQRD